MKFKFLCVFLVLYLAAGFAKEKESKDCSLLPNTLIEMGVSPVVNGCVNAISGDFVDSSVDLVVPGPEPLVLQRSYASSEYGTDCYYNGWRHNHQSWVEVAEMENPDTKKQYLKGKYKELSGRGAFYFGRYREKKKPVTIGYDKEHSGAASTNCGDGIITARNNPKYNAITYKHKEKELSVSTASGSKYQYSHLPQHNPFHVFGLSDEWKPNRRRLHYERNGVTRLTKIELTDHPGSCTFASITIAHPNIFALSSNDESEFSATASDGRKVLYKLKKFSPRENVGKQKKEKVRSYFISKAIRPNAPTETYEYDYKHNPLMTMRKRPDGRYLQIEYYMEKKEQVGDREVAVTDEYAFRRQRVKLLKAPVGTDRTPITTHRFFYSLNRVPGQDYSSDYKRKGSTSVYDAYNHQTKYIYTTEHRLSEIWKNTGTAKPYNRYSTESFVWGSDDSDEPGYLQATYLQDGTHNVIKARTFEYDSFGNVVKDTFYGNITGNSAPIIANGRKPIENGCDCFCKTYKYGLGSVPHLMTEESSDDGKSVIYGYIPDTELLESQLTLFHGEIKHRQFFEYNAYGTVTKVITDDGSSADKNNLAHITQRLVKYIFPRQKTPFGLPERIDEMYLDLNTGQEVLIKRTCNDYTIEGYLQKQDVYDCNGKYAFTLEWKHDPHGNVILEKDALGQTIERQYDDNDNLIYEKGPAQNRYTVHTYDWSNRRIRSEEIHDDGKHLTTSLRYDYLGNRIAVVDTFGNEATFDYDEFGRVIVTHYPPIPNENGDLIPTTTTNEYDICGNVIRFVDQTRNTILTSYNIHGEPTAIHYPDDTHEYFEYNLDGTLKKSTAKNGTVTLYTYDCFKNVIQKDVISSDQTLISRTSATYSAFNLTSTTDPSGIETIYKYDGAGRLISVAKADRLTTHEFDSLGRISETKEWYGPTSYRVKKQKYDFLNRVEEEKIEEGSTDKILRFSSFAYDADNNVIRKTTHNQAGTASTFIYYNGCKQPIKEVDPLGHTTHIEYNYNGKNPYGQIVLEITKTDPLGNQTITTMNSLLKPGMVVKRNSLGKVLSKKELFYSGIGDCQHVYETVITPNAPDRQIINSFCYDSQHRLHEIIEAVGTPEQKHTQIRYNKFGQKDEIIKPDGVRLLHTYDSMGRLFEFKASDDSFTYKYTYDNSDNPICVADLKNNTQITREYVNGRLKSENFGTGQCVNYEYDLLDRPVQVAFSDYSTVQYVYDGINLLDVQRLSSTSEIKYKHSYLNHDPSGLAANIQHPGAVGKETLSYDLLGRLIKSQQSQWSEEISYDAAGNLNELTIQDPVSKKLTRCQYTYDDLYQLKSETGVASHKYVCDSLYNCINCDNVPRKINNFNQLLEQGKVTFTYDLNGNRITRLKNTQEIQYSYDGLDRLTEVLRDNLKWEYTYDAFNRRLSKKTYSRKDEKWVLSEQCSYLYQGQNEVGSCDAEGHIVELRILGIGKGAEIGASVAFEIQDQTYVPIHDHNGNVTHLVDVTSGKTVESYKFSAFGEEKIYNENGHIIFESSVKNPWRYASKRIDPETGFLNFGRRYYDPVTMRWISPDPIGHEGGPNLYAYVLNSPLNHIDLYGLLTKPAELPSFNPSLRQAASKFSNYVVKRASYKLTQCFGTSLLPNPVAGVSKQVSECANAIYKPRCSRVYIAGDRDYTNGRLGMFFMPGIGNNFNDAENGAEDMSNRCGRQIVHCVASDSDRILDGAGDCIKQKLYIDTDTVNVAVKELQRMCTMYEYVLCNVHSQGGLVMDRAVRQLSQDDRKKLIIITYGSATIIDSKELGIKYGKNYVSMCDPIPFITDPAGCLAGIFNGNVTYLPSATLPGTDHPFGNKAYQKQFRRILDNFNKAYGVGQ